MGVLLLTDHRRSLDLLPCVWGQVWHVPLLRGSLAFSLPSWGVSLLTTLSKANGGTCILDTLMLDGGNQEDLKRYCLLQD